MTTISERQRICLVSLAERTGDGYAIYFRTVAGDTGLRENEARTAVRALVRKGLARRVIGLFQDDGYLCGSGHEITPAGQALIPKSQPDT